MDLATLNRTFTEFYRTYPELAGRASTQRQPLHTVYGGAHIWNAHSTQRMADLAQACLDTYATDASAFAGALGQGDDGANWAHIYARVRAKLQTEAVEDYRIDFEDGYGPRPDAEEDGHAASSAAETAKALRENSLPQYCGIRIKPLSPEYASRSLRTLDLFLNTFLQDSKGALPPNFVVTLPKVLHPVQTELLATHCAAIETKWHLPHRSIRIELMIETSQLIATNQLLALIPACDQRLRGVHFGTYDYTASCDVVAHYQTMDSPVCDYAKHVIQTNFAGTGIWLSDGATTTMPVGPHKGKALSESQSAENRAEVHKAWRLSWANIRHSLASGWYQGWDLHPAQLPVRYAAVYHVFLQNYASAAERLRAFVQRSAQATRVGSVFDDAATGQGLLNYFIRGLNCGALTQEEVDATGVPAEVLANRSFARGLKQ